MKSKIPLIAVFVVALTACSDSGADTDTTAVSTTQAAAVATTATQEEPTTQAPTTTTAPTTTAAATTQPAPTTTQPAPTTTQPAPTTKPTPPTTKPPANVTARLKTKRFAYQARKADSVTRIRVTPIVTRGAPAHFRDYQLDATTATQVPWYVSIHVNNLGGAMLRNPSFIGDLRARNEAGDELDAVVVRGHDQCRAGKSAKRFNKQSEPLKRCRVFMVPRGQRLAALTMDHTPGDKKIRWSVPQKIGPKAKPPKPPKGGPDGKRAIQGKSKRVTWEGGELRFRAGIRPLSVVKGRKGDIAGFNLDASDKLATPWYVTITTRHAGKKPTNKVPRVDARTVAYNEQGQRVRGVIMIGGVPQCQDPPTPKRFRPNTKIQTCTAFLVPDGQEIATVGVIHNQSFDEVKWKIRPRR